MADDVDEDKPRSAEGELHTFLIADVRGYTRFTEENGDEAASELARKFAGIVHEVVPEHGGRVLELRGDEALSVFTSARAALWSAVELQRRFRERVNGEPALPLGVGIGLDAGEAVPTEGGYRGRALNVASRLCSLAKPGQILASETVRNLAGRQESATYASRRPTRVKGVSEPVRHVEVVPEEELPPLPPAPLRARRRDHPTGRYLLVVAAVLAAAAAVISYLVLRGDPDEASPVPVAVVPNSLVAIDPRTNQVVDSIPIGRTPGPVAVGQGAVWVGNVSQNTLARIDPDRRAVVETRGLPITPDWLVYAADALWIVDSGCDFPCRQAEIGRAGPLTLNRLDPGTFTLSAPIELGPGGPVRINIAGSDDAIWVTNRNNSTVYRIDPETRRAMAEVELPDALSLAVDDVGVWVIEDSTTMLKHIDSATDEVDGAVRVGADPEGVAVWEDTVWVANFSPEPALWRIDRRFGEVRGTVPVTGSPAAVVADSGAVWVAHYQRGAVSRVDATTNEVVATIELGRLAYHLAAGEGYVWVTVR